MVGLVLAGGLAGCVGDTAPRSPRPTSGDDQASASDAIKRQPADVHLTHDFARGSGEVTFEVPEGTVAEVRHVYFAGAADPADLATPCYFLPDARIVVTDPSGDVVLTALSGAGANLQVSPCPASDDGQKKTGQVPLEPGTWTARFEGRGLGTGHVLLRG